MQLTIKDVKSSEIVKTIHNISIVPRIGEGITFFMADDFVTYGIEELFHIYNEYNDFEEIVVYVDTSK